MKPTDVHARDGANPFRRDLSDEQRCLEQRDSPLGRLGVVPRFLRGARILELGPGHGETALYLLQQRPEHLVPVESAEQRAAAPQTLLDAYTKVAA